MPTNSTRFTGKGRFCAHPRSYVTTSDALVAGASLAFDDDRKVGESWVENTMFFYCEGWGRTAQHLMDKFRKGDLCHVEGRVKQSRFVPEGKSEEIVMTKIWIDSIHLISRPEKKGDDHTSILTMKRIFHSSLLMVAVVAVGAIVYAHELFLRAVRKLLFASLRK
jgi:single-stranded DNA-binding protein